MNMYYNKIGDIMKNTFSMKSSNNRNNLYGVIWPIEDNIKGIVIVMHGLGDKTDNYEELALRLNKEGYIVAGIDQIGFGKSVQDLNLLGYYEDKENTLKYYIEDTKKLYDKLTSEYPSTNVYIIGVSYGSFIARLFLSHYHNLIKGTILIGTAYLSPLFMSFAKFMTRYLAVGKGWNDRNTYLYRKTITKLNDRFEDKTVPSWLNSNIIYVLDNADVYSTCRLTLTGYYVLYNLMEKVNKKKYINMIDKNENIYLLSGKDDPVTSFGMDVYKLSSLYKKHGITNIQYKIYNGMRHDLIHEVNRDIIINDIINYLNK